MLSRPLASISVDPQAQQSTRPRVVQLTAGRCLFIFDHPTGRCWCPAGRSFAHVDGVDPNECQECLHSISDHEDFGRSEHPFLHRSRADDQLQSTCLNRN